MHHHCRTLARAGRTSISLAPPCTPPSCARRARPLEVDKAVLVDGGPPRRLCVELIPVGARRTRARRTGALATRGPGALAPGGPRDSGERRRREEREYDESLAIHFVQRAPWLQRRHMRDAECESTIRGRKVPTSVSVSRSVNGGATACHCAARGSGARAAKHGPEAQPPSDAGRAPRQQAGKEVAARAISSAGSGRRDGLRP